jgi:hypothetical protein
MKPEGSLPCSQESTTGLCLEPDKSSPRPPEPFLLRSILILSSKACTVYDRLNSGIAGSNPAWGMDVCLRVSVLCCPVSVEALFWTDPPTKESYQMSVDREVL